MSIPPDGKASFGSATSCTPSFTVHRPFDTRQLGQLLSRRGSRGLPENGQRQRSRAGRLIAEAADPLPPVRW